MSSSTTPLRRPVYAYGVWLTSRGTMDTSRTPKSWGDPQQCFSFHPITSLTATYPVMQSCRFHEYQKDGRNVTGLLKQLARPTTGASSGNRPEDPTHVLFLLGDEHLGLNPTQAAELVPVRKSSNRLPSIVTEPPWEPFNVNANSSRASSGRTATTRGIDARNKVHYYHAGRFSDRKPDDIAKLKGWPIHVRQFTSAGKDTGREVVYPGLQEFATEPTRYSLRSRADLTDAGNYRHSSPYATVIVVHWDRRGLGRLQPEDPSKDSEQKLLLTMGPGHALSDSAGKGETQRSKDLEKYLANLASQQGMEHMTLYEPLGWMGDVLPYPQDQSSDDSRAINADNYTVEIGTEGQISEPDLEEFYSKFFEDDSVK